jgi:hypothetical protein
MKGVQKKTSVLEPTMYLAKGTLLLFTVLCLILHKDTDFLFKKIIVTMKSISLFPDGFGDSK